MPNNEAMANIAKKRIMLNSSLFVIMTPKAAKQIAITAAK